MSTVEITLPSKKYKQNATIFSVVAIIVCIACVYLDFNPLVIFTQFHFLIVLLGDMFPPNYGVVSDNASIAQAILQTMSMAFLGTLYGGVIAIVIAFLAASTTMPYKIVRIIADVFLSLMRAVPVLVYILVFVIAVGPGAFAGALALIVSTIGNFGRLFTEIIENTENPPGEAIFSVGASRWQVIRFSVLPQIMPSFIANLIYSFDVNMRTAVALGVFGGGGIGFQFQMAKNVLHYRDVTALISIIIVLIFLTEKLSDYLRRRILGEGKLK